jgi:hypothetical protein
VRVAAIAKAQMLVMLRDVYSQIRTGAEKMNERE